MTFLKLTALSLLSLSILALANPAAQAQQAQAQATISPQVAAFAKKIASTCPGNWENQSCLKDISESNIAMVSNYAQALDNAGKNEALEPLKQTCAASTAATKGVYPPEAMKSAFTECANGIYDITTKTSISPDQSHYQLLIAGILCLSKDPQCKLLETSLEKTAKSLP